MHDPLVVAFEIRRPWPKRSGIDVRRWYWPPLVTVWHREPGGHDSGEVCKHYRRYQDAAGDWQYKFLHGWKLHVHHWKVQVHPLQEVRRWVLTRCAWCGGRHSKGDAVNHSLSWDGPCGRWWQGEPGLYHGDCASVKTAKGRCLCDDPVFDMKGWGRCARCDGFRSHGATPAVLERQRLLAAVPDGQRDPDVYRRICQMAQVEAEG